MTQRIIFNFIYSLFCNQCGALLKSNISPTKCGNTFAEFDITSVTPCSICGNAIDFNIAKNEIKRLKIDEESETVPF